MPSLVTISRSYYWKVTYSPKLRRVSIYNSECNFACRGCPYLTGLFKIEGRPLKIEKIEAVLLKLKPETVFFCGREPTVNPDLPELIDFAKKLKAHVRILTNGSNPIPEGVDAASVSIKAYTDSIHVDYTGKPNHDVLKNFAEAYERGVELKASSVFIPNYIDIDEIEKIAHFIASIDQSIPYHIIGFIPFGNVPWRAPTLSEMLVAVEIARKYLKNVTWSLPNTALKDYPSSLPETSLRDWKESVRVL
ncbi:MAG: radical SAM protein [Candidatus Nezhaarchaeota archaeon]|nr:radical SAM protein [Candidatus Nezhaarchaeota archaeon]